VTLRVAFTERASAQVDETARWWRQNRSAAPDLFERELGALIAMLANTPEVGRPYDHPRVRGVRRMHLGRSRYHVYYLHDRGAERVVVIAVWSAARGKGPPLGGG
jgi:plasmid stabilization system protein ParE